LCYGNKLCPSINEYDEEKDRYMFEGEAFESDIEILETLLEGRKINWTIRLALHGSHAYYHLNKKIISKTLLSFDL